VAELIDIAIDNVIYMYIYVFQYYQDINIIIILAYRRKKGREERRMIGRANADTCVMSV